jgi:hypothetical protein
MKLIVKSAKEMLAVLDETKETLFKDRKCTTHTPSGSTKEPKSRAAPPHPRIHPSSRRNHKHRRAENGQAAKTRFRKESESVHTCEVS